MTKKQEPTFLHPATSVISHEKTFLSAIISLCLGVRLWNIQWGLPDFFEEAVPFSIAWRFWNWGQEGFDFNPHFFNYPALSFILHFIGQVFHYIIGNVFGLYSDMNAFQNAYKHDPTIFVIIARSISVLGDVGTALLTFKIGRTIATTATGYLAATLVAVNAALLRQSQYISVDTPLMFFCALSLFFMCRLIANPSWQSAALVGVSIGLATATKYTGALLVLPLVALIPFPPNKEFATAQRLRLAFASIGVSALVFAALNPYLFLNFSEFIQDFAFESRHMATGHLGLGSSMSSTEFYFLHALPYTLGIGVAFFVIIGIGVAVIRKNRTLLWLTIFPLLYLVIISTWKMHAERYLLPAFPALFVVTAFGITSLWHTFTERMRLAFSLDQTLPRISVLVLAIGWHAPSILSHHHSFSKPDTRSLAMSWIREHVPAGGAIASIPMGWDALSDNYRLMTIPFDPYTPASVAPFYDMLWYEDFDIVVGSEYDYGRYAQEPKRYRDFLAYYDSLRARSRLVYEVTPKSDQQGGSIWLFKPDRPKQVRFKDNLFSKLDAVPESMRVGAFLRGLSNILVGKKQLGKVEQLARTLVAREGNDPDAHRMLAIVLYDIGNNAEALEEIQHVLQDRPGDADLLAMQGDILVRMKKFAEAEKCLTKARELKPSLEMVYMDLMTIYVARNDRQQAIDLLVRYLETLPPKSGKARSVQAYINGLKNSQAH